MSRKIGSDKTRRAYVFLKGAESGQHSVIEHTPQDVARIVTSYVQNEHRGGVTLAVDENGVRRDEFGWKVPLHVSAELRRLYEYYETLANVEEDLEEKEHLKVLFVPLFAEETT